MKRQQCREIAAFCRSHGRDDYGDILDAHAAVSGRPRSGPAATTAEARGWLFIASAKQRGHTLSEAIRMAIEGGFFHRRNSSSPMSEEEVRTRFLKPQTRVRKAIKHLSGDDKATPAVLQKRTSPFEL